MPFGTCIRFPQSQECSKETNKFTVSTVLGNTLYDPKPVLAGKELTKTETQKLWNGFFGGPFLKKQTWETCLGVGTARDGGK